MLTAKSNLGWETLKSMKKLAAVHFFVGATAGGAFFLPNSYFVDKWRSLYECLEGGFPSRLKPQINECFLEVLNDIKLEDTEKERITPFKTSRLGMWHAGYSRYNTLIGIPWYFELDSPYDADRPAKCWGKPVEWHSPEGERQRETLVLKKNEKKFAIAREIFEARAKKNYIIPLIPASLSFMSFVMLHYFKTNFIKVVQYSKWQKRGIHCFVYTLACLTYFVAKDSITMSIEYDADQEVANIGLEEGKPTDLTFDYINGGIEYYNKMLIRNKIIKDLYLPKYINWMVTDEGDLTQYFRKKHASIVIRKKELEGMLANFKRHGQLHLSNVTITERREKMMEEQTKVDAENKKTDSNIVNVS